MRHAAEKLPPQGDEDKAKESSSEDEIIEVTSDMIVEDAHDDSFEMKEELEVAESDKARKAKKSSIGTLRKKLGKLKEAKSSDVKKSLDELKAIEAARVREEELAQGVAEAKRLEEEAHAERQARNAEAEARAKASMRKKRESDKRKSAMKDLRTKLAEPKQPKKEPGVIPAPPGFEEAQAEEAEYQAVEKSVREELKKRTEGARFTEKDEAWFKKGEELESAENTDTLLPDSLEPYLERINKLDIPGFDSSAFAEMSKRHHKLDQELSDAESGALKIGWFKRRKMKRELRSLNKALEPMWDEIDSYLTDLQRAESWKDMDKKERESYIAMLHKVHGRARRAVPSRSGTSRVGNIKP